MLTKGEFNTSSRESKRHNLTTARTTLNRTKRWRPTTGHRDAPRLQGPTGKRRLNYGQRLASS